MDFLRRNIGLLSYGGVSLVLAVLIIIGIRSAGKTAADREKKVRRQMDFFKKVETSEVTPSRANCDTAEENLSLVQDKFYDIRHWLFQTYTVPREAPPSAVECVRTLQDVIRQMRAELLAKEISVGNCKFFSFDSLATSRTLPPSADVPAIMRQLKIVREIVRLVGLSGVAEISNIGRPLGLNVLEEDLYTITPLELSVLGEYPKIEELVNKLQRDSQYLFFLRNLAIGTKDQAPGGRPPGFTGKGAGGPAGGAAAPRPGAGGMGGMPGMMGGAGPGAMAGEAGMEQMGVEAGMDVPPDAGMAGEAGFGGAFPAARGAAVTPAAPAAAEAAAAEEVAPAENMTKEQLEVFEPRMFNASFRLDLVEFREPKKEE